MFGCDEKIPDKKLCRDTFSGSCRKGKGWLTVKSESRKFKRFEKNYGRMFG